MKSASTKQLIGVLTGFCLAGCGGSDSNSKNVSGQRVPVQLEVQTSSTPSATRTQASRKGALDEPLTDGTNTLVITRARLLAKAIRLHGPKNPSTEMEGVGDASDEMRSLGDEDAKGALFDKKDGGMGEHGKDGGADDHGKMGGGKMGQDEDDGTYFKVGPTIVELDLTGMPTAIAVSSILEGTYDHLSVHFHKINPKAPADANAIAQNSAAFADFTASGNYNIVIDGTWNGTPFQYKGSQSMNGHYALDPVLVVAAQTDAGAVTTNLNVNFDMTQWFRGQKGNNRAELLDPNDVKNGKEIAHSIARSVRAKHKKSH